MCYVISCVYSARRGSPVDSDTADAASLALAPSRFRRASAWRASFSESPSDDCGGGSGAPAITSVNSPRGAVNWAMASDTLPLKTSSCILVSSRQTAIRLSPSASQDVRAARGLGGAASRRRCQRAALGGDFAQEAQSVGDGGAAGSLDGRIRRSVGDAGYAANAVVTARRAGQARLRGFLAPPPPTTSSRPGSLIGGASPRPTPAPRPRRPLGAPG